MAIIVLNSIFDTENGECVERNVHDVIRGEVLSYNPESIKHIDFIDREIASLKEKGFDIVYSLRYEPSRLKEIYKF